MQFNSRFLVVDKPYWSLLVLLLGVAGCSIQLYSDSGWIVPFTVPDSSAQTAAPPSRQQSPWFTI